MKATTSFRKLLICIESFDMFMLKACCLEASTAVFVSSPVQAEVERQTTRSLNEAPFIHNFFCKGLLMPLQRCLAPQLAVRLCSSRIRDDMRERSSFSAHVDSSSSLRTIPFTKMTKRGIKIFVFLCLIYLMMISLDFSSFLEQDNRPLFF